MHVSSSRRGKAKGKAERLAMVKVRLFRTSSLIRLPPAIVVKRMRTYSSCKACKLEGSPSGMNICSDSIALPDIDSSTE